MKAMRDTRRVGIWAGAALACTAMSAAWPQSYPTKPVRYVVPFAPGVANDVVARILTERLSRLWEQPVIVDNRAGAAGMLGAAFAAKSPPDGYTLLHCNIGPNAIAVSLYDKPPYDQLRDFAPVTRIGVTPNAITAHPSVPFRSIKDFIAYAKANPGKLSYGAGLAGTSPHMAMELLKLRMKFDVVHIPYKVGSQAVTDTVAGQVPVNVFNIPVIISAVKAGRLRALAVTSAQRAVQLPDVPTLQETGVPSFDVSAWYGVCAPAGTPTALLDKLHGDFTAVLRLPEVQQKLTELVMTPAPTSREEFDRFIRAEVARWAEVIREARIPKE